MIDKMDHSVTPAKEELVAVVQGKNGVVLADLCEHIERTYQTKPQIAYSSCSGGPGWNLKYKKSGKAICTIYPETDGFFVLVTFNGRALEMFEIAGENFSPYMRKVVAAAKGLPDNKWFTVEVRDGATAEEIKRLLQIKFG